MGFSRFFLLLLPPLLAFRLADAQAEILRVSLSGDGSNGSSWATAYNSIGAALVAATSGDDIRVASGTYFEAIEMKMGVDVYGGFTGIDGVDELATRDFRTFKTIIDATGMGRTAIIGASHTELDGFTVRNGKAPVLSPGVGTGGIECFDLEEVVIRNCIVRNNEAVVIVSNPSIPIFSGGRGGGIRLGRSEAVIDSCAIVSNVARAAGGGIYITGDGDYTIRNCLFAENIGGGLYIDGVNSIETVLNCTFGRGNIDGDLGSPIGRRNDLKTGGENVSLVNTVVSAVIGTITSASYSNLPNYPGPGNIDEDPLWVDPENGDYRLKPSSPCIDAGTDTGLTNDLDGNPRPVDVRDRGYEDSGAFDMGAYEFQLNPADLDANGYVNGEDLILFQEQRHGSEP